jgi:hypothetical protein
MISESPLQQKPKSETTGQKSTSYCFTCKKSLPLTAFYKNKSRRCGVQKSCKNCQNKYAKARNAAAACPENQLCELCNEELATNWDHNHDSGEFRGWLCHGCNSGLGKFRDRTDLLLKAIHYLSINNGSQI